MRTSISGFALCAATSAAIGTIGLACSTGATVPDSERPSVGSAGAPLVATGSSSALLDVSDHAFCAATPAIIEGRRVFRFDTFGDEAFWGDTLKLHEAIEGQAHGGVGAGVSPATALSVGLKVDVEALPAALVKELKAGTVNLNDPATTLALLGLNAVVGVTGTPNSDGSLKTIGIQCALCHSTVDDSFAPGIGKRLDGWPNRDLDVGAIISLAPNLTPVAAFLGVSVPTVLSVLKEWGPGRYDAELFLDGRGVRPDGKTGATLLPAAFGLAGVNLHTYTGWGSVPYWNAFVAILEMHGQGNFFDPRLDNAVQFPVAAKNMSGHTKVAIDLVSSKLPDLQAYQLSIPAPPPPAGSFDVAAAERGGVLFSGAAKCSGCHMEPLYTESGWAMHTAAELGIDDFQASRSPDDRYRTTPLRGLWTHQKGGFYHDGRFATLADVVNHYDTTFALGLTGAEQRDIVQYLKSL